MWFTEHLLRVYLDFLRHIYSSLLPTPFQVRIFRSFLRIFIASCILSPEAGAGLGILSIWSLYQNLLSFYWSSLFKVYDFPYFFLLMENLGQGFCLCFFFCFFVFCFCLLKVGDSIPQLHVLPPLRLCYIQLYL